MFNTTNISTKMPLLAIQEILENAHLLIAIGIALCIFLWYAVNFRTEQILKGVLRQHQKHQQQKPEKLQEQQQWQEKHQHEQLKMAAEAGFISVAPSTPHPCQTFRRLNPIQSVERQRLRRSKSAAGDATATENPTATTTSEAPATPESFRLCPNFGCLNPLQSVERQRCKRYDLANAQKSSE